MSRQRFFTLTVILALAVAGGALVGTLMGPLGSASAEELDLATASSTGRSAVLPSFADLAEEASPSVVLITREVFRDQQQGHGGMDMEDIPPFFRRFFGEPFGEEGPEQEGPSPGPRTSSGSGFFITEDGYILTNKHVVEDGERLTVETADGQIFEAKLAGSDPYYDVALLKIDADQKFPALPLGSTDALRIGEWVMAIGNPISFRDSVTVGVVSGKGRRLEMSPDQLSSYIQTDAAINFGNSGGPLINARGEVIGINTAIVRQRRISAMQREIIQGINFALPIDVVRPHLDQLASEGTVRRGYLGVSVQSVDTEAAEFYGLDEARGALVGDVTDGTPAAEAGIRANDIILSVDGTELEGSSQLVSIISNRSPGDAVELRILRDGERMTKTVTLGERRIGIDEDTPAPRQQEEEDGEVSGLGFTVSPMPPQMKEAMAEQGIEGLRITDVDPRSNAYQKGLRANAFLLELNGTATPTLEAFKQARDAVEPGSVVRVRVADPTGNEVVLFFRAPENGS
jgi:serine protease Do